MKIFEPGDIAKITTAGFNWTSDGWATVGSESGEGIIELYERIDLNSYPSCSDFYGRVTKVMHGNIALIIRYLGRPFKVGRDPQWFKYDLYEIMISGQKCQAFRQNLSSIRD